MANAIQSLHPEAVVDNLTGELGERVRLTAASIGTDSRYPHFPNITMLVKRVIFVSMFPYTVSNLLSILASFPGSLPTHGTRLDQCTKSGY